MAGRPLAGGWRAVFSHLRGDLEFKSTIFKFNSWHHNSICKDCAASKVNAALTFTNLLPSAPWAATAVSHEQWVASRA
eukprot:8177225-Alexandrium_andersonii.AAC.1